MGKRKIFRLNERQQEFAIQNLKLVYKFLYLKRLDSGEYFDIVIMGYLRAVVRYDETPQLQRYKFSTIAFNCMRTEVSNFYRYNNAKKRRAEVISYDASYCDNKGSFLDILPSNYNLENSFEEKEYWKDIFKWLDAQGTAILEMKLSGHSNREVSWHLGIPLKIVEEKLFEIGIVLFDENSDFEINVSESESSV